MADCLADLTLFALVVNTREMDDVIYLVGLRDHVVTYRRYMGDCRLAEVGSLSVRVPVDRFVLQACGLLGPCCGMGDWLAMEDGDGLAEG